MAYIYTEEEIVELINSKSIDCFYNSKGWRLLSDKVIDENHGDCIKCKERGLRTKATLTHHVKPLKERPDLAYERYDVDGSMQLMPLCHDCHEMIHSRGKYVERKGYTNDEMW